MKIQRPDVERVVRTDIEILRQVASLATRRSRLGRVYDLVEIVDELAATLVQELDYTAEAANAHRLARALSTDPHVVITRLCWEYTTRRVPTMERIRETSLEDMSPPSALKARFQPVSRGRATRPTCLGDRPPA